MENEVRKVELGDTKYNHLIPQTLRAINDYINECKILAGLEPDDDGFLAIICDDIMVDYRTDSEDAED